MKIPGGGDDRGRDGIGRGGGMKRNWYIAGCWGMVNGWSLQMQNM